MFEFEFWYNLPTLFRVIVSLVLIGITVIAYLGGTIWPAPGIIGLVLLFFAGSGGNKGGYNF